MTEATPRLSAKIMRRLEKGGLSGLLARAKEVILWELRKLDPVLRARLRESDEWDSHFGTDTGGHIAREDLGFPGELAEWCNWYEPAQPWVVREFFTHLPDDLRSYHWVDLGSGKGRVVLMCSMFELAAVTGVELSGTLHRIAERNLDLFPKERRRAGEVTLWQGSAEEYQFPQQNLVVSLFNSFGPPILDRVLDNLEASLNQFPREAYLIYMNPIHAASVERRARFTRTAVTERYKVYRWNTAPT